MDVTNFLCKVLLIDTLRGLGLSVFHFSYDEDGLFCVSGMVD